MAGYSGTPLARKLGIKEGFHVLALDAPADYQDLLDGLPDDVSLDDAASEEVDLVHVFVTEQSDLIAHLARLRKKIRPEVPVWISWPKKASKVPTTVTEDSIRDAALPIGYVDIKVCAVSDVWSGLKLVVRKELR